MLKCDACHKPAWACAECLADMEMPKPTNADRIRGMGDEELAEFLDATQAEECKDLHELAPDGTWKHKSLVNGWLNWLRQPAEEATT